MKTASYKTAIVVFDAGSNDGSKEWLKQYVIENDDLAIDILESKEGEDSSFSAGINFACQYARTKYPDTAYYLFYETDNEIDSFEPIALASRLLEQSPKLAAVGFTVAKRSGAKAGYGASFPTVLQFLLGQNLTYLWHLDAPVPSWQKFEGHRWTICDIVFTSPILVKRVAWEQSGGLDQKVFPFSDCDSDWSWRLARMGWKLGVLETSEVIHDNGEQLSDWSKSRALHFHRGRLRLLKKQLGAWVNVIKPLLLLRHCLEYICILALILAGKKPISTLESRKTLIETVFYDYRDIKSSARRSKA